MIDEIRSLVDYRLQEARDSREEAEILLGRGKYRGALNRAYYSLFYAALALLASKQLTAVKHSGVISLVHREFVKSGLIARMSLNRSTLLSICVIKVIIVI